MSKRLFAKLGLFSLIAVSAVAQTGGTIQVDVTYTGSGTVDASHKVYIALWDSADFNTAPVGMKSLDSKNGTVSFSDVQKGPAYITAIYDPTGKWDAQSPPTPGSSLGMYSAHPPTPDPIDVAPGKTTKVKVSFNDDAKMP